MPQVSDDQEAHTLSQLLDQLEATATGDAVSVRDVVTQFGDRGFTPFILLVSVLLITPLSGILGMPTLSAIVIISLAVQALLNRRHLWLPGFVLNRSIAAPRLRWAVNWLRRPAAFLDRHAHKRLQLLVKGPGRILALLLCILVPATWPLLEVLPLVTSLGAMVVSLFAFGLFTRDGLYALFGYLMIALLILTGSKLLG